jgi:hypothetical protein
MKKTELGWLETPWDNMPHDKLVREMQKAYSALIAADSILRQLRCGQEHNPFWQAGMSDGRHGSGARALEKCEEVFRPYKAAFKEYQVYHEFYRVVDPLFFKKACNYNNWAVCPKCGRMLMGFTRDKTETDIIGKTCSEAMHWGSCDGVMRWLAWRDIKEWKKKRADSESAGCR